MSYPYGVRKKVFVFILDENSLVVDKRIHTLQKIRPDIKAEGSERSCGREIVKKLISRGFLHPVMDLGGFALFADMNNFGNILKSEVARQIEEQKNNVKNESVPI